ncbi:hypothetical protein ACLOE0_02860 [Limosilactobacillus fermentum]|uniref:hypothetical protein n=2 Tax=Limosilactobacillus fermentum TaxID=1613 RepID=UPI003EB852E2
MWIISIIIKWVVVLLWLLWVAVWTWDLFKTRKGKSLLGFMIAVILGAIIAFSIAGWSEKLVDAHHEATAKTAKTTSNSSDDVADAEIPGNKVDTSDFDNHDFYYTKGDDDNIRYFINNDDKLTAIKQIFSPDPMTTEYVKMQLTEILDDNNIKYTLDKLKANSYIPGGDSFNVYSPKYKRWFHVQMQRTGSKISQYSIFSGKDTDADD